MRVSSVEFVRNYGTLADRALSEAVTITRNGRDRLVVLSAEEYKPAVTIPACLIGQ